MTLHLSSLPTKEENTCATWESITFFDRGTKDRSRVLKGGSVITWQLQQPRANNFKVVIFQILAVYFRSLNDYSSASKFYDKALLECSGSWGLGSTCCLINDKGNKGNYPWKSYSKQLGNLSKSAAQMRNCRSIKRSNEVVLWFWHQPIYIQVGSPDSTECRKRSQNFSWFAYLVAKELWHTFCGFQVVKTPQNCICKESITPKQHSKNAKTVHVGRKKK